MNLLTLILLIYIMKILLMETRLSKDLYEGPIQR